MFLDLIGIYKQLFQQNDFSCIQRDSIGEGGHSLVFDLPGY